MKTLKLGLYQYVKPENQTDQSYIDANYEETIDGVGYVYYEGDTYLTPDQICL